MPNVVVVDGLQRGPDLNPSRSPLDKKLYRQIVLPNGLRCVLIEDVVAQQQQQQPQSSYHDDMLDPDDDDDDEEDEESDSDTANGNGPAFDSVDPLSAANGSKNGTKDVHDNVHDNDESSSSLEEEESGLRDAAACVLVGVGSMYDPPECQGLAHFLEHLLFMGSNKYPDENEYDSFVTKHGGCTNAYTEWEYTAYTLQIPQEYLFAALDRLAQFFIAPLMLPSAVERELQAIESEFQLHKNSDSTRWQQLLAATSTPGHPVASFAWGNVRSLKEIPALRGEIDPLQELWKFYHRYYYAANIRLVVVGAYALDVLERQVMELFSTLPSLPRESGPYALPINPQQSLTSWSDQCNKYCSPMETAGNPLERTTSKIFRIVPVKDQHLLTLTWPIPPQTNAWKSKPTDFVAHLLGHETHGSLLSYFRYKSWAINCTVCSGSDGLEQASSHALFTARFTLSEQGLVHWKEMVGAVYEYIGMLRHRARQGWPDWMYEELRRTEALSYQYQDEPSPEELVESLAEAMAPHQNLPPERLLDGMSLLFEFDPSAIQNLLDQYLTPHNARIDVTSSSFGRAADYPDETFKTGVETIIPNLVEIEEVDGSFDATSAGSPQVEPMFGTLFWCSSVPGHLLTKWEQQWDSPLPTVPLALPPPNPFVPTQLDLKHLPDDDAHHPLLQCSLKLCIAVGKTKQWLPGTPVRYDKKKRSLLISYEDDHEQWHRLDDDDDNTVNKHELHVRPGMEGSFDGKTIRFRVLSTKGPRLLGDDSDFAVQDGKSFPPIPPALSASRLPREISNSNVLKMWWLQDRHYHRPIAELRLQIVCATANKSPWHRMCAELLRLLCVDALVEDSYMADVCDLTYSLEATDVGFSLKLDGFDHKLLDLFQRVMSVVLSFSGSKDGLPPGIAEDRFHACVEVLKRQYKNSEMSSAKLCSSVRLQAFRPTVWSVHQKNLTLDALTIATFLETSSALLGAMAIECLFHGNVDRSDAEQARDLILSLVRQSFGDSAPGLSRKKYPAQSVLRFPETDAPPILTVPSKDPADPNTAVELYFQVGKDTLKDRVLIDVLVHMMEEKFFDQVRTKDQFGYDCDCDARWSYGIIGIIFHVVTNVKSASSVLERIDKFLAEFRKNMEASDDFLEHLVGLASQKLDMFNSLSEETSSYWDEIRDGRFDWQAWRNEALCLKTLTKQEVIEAFDKWLAPTTRRKMLAVQVVGSGTGDAAMGRPEVESDAFGTYVDEQVSAFHSHCKQQYWGRVNSKLF